MGLEPGNELHAELTGASLLIKKQLGQGGQGIVLQVDGPNGPAAVKWYPANQATSQQREAISMLVQKGPPAGEPGKRFVWPQDLVTAKGSRNFGYLMALIDRRRFSELGEVQNGLRHRPTYPVMCKISYQIANSYRALHLEGLCYRDISAGNVMFDSQTGDVLICDNDNVGVNRQSDAQVDGTPYFQAPEVVIGTARPSANTDQFSLAVLLFNLWTWHHPLEGKMVSRFPILTKEAERQIHGEDPVFIFDPSDARNRLPNDPEYSAVYSMWKSCPPSLQKLFIRSFTVGLKNPDGRVTEGEWQVMFRTLRDGRLSCPHCRADNIWDIERASLHCWNCDRNLIIPPKLKVSLSTGPQHVLLSAGAILLRRHVDTSIDAGGERATERVGQVVQHPTKPNVWGLRNLTSAAWAATFPDGSTKEVPPGRSAPLSAGLKLDLGTASAHVIP